MASSDGAGSLGMGMRTRLVGLGGGRNAETGAEGGVITGAGWLLVLMVWKVVGAGGGEGGGGEGAAELVVAGGGTTGSGVGC